MPPPNGDPVAFAPAALRNGFVFCELPLRNGFAAGSALFSFMFDEEAVCSADGLVCESFPAPPPKRALAAVPEAKPVP